MSLFFKKYMAAAAISLTAFGLAVPAHAQEKPASLGVGVFSFTSGATAAYGVPGRNAAELMIETINANGGIAGVPLKASYVDEGQGTEGVITEFRKLAADPANQAMIAALSSGNCMALAPVVDELKIPTVGWNCDTHQLFAKSAHPYYFRPNGNTVPEFLAYAFYMLSVKPDVKTVAIINPDYAFGHDAANIFKAALKTFKPDVQVVAELFPKLGSATFQTEISRLTTARPDVIFSNLWGGDLENFVRQATPRGLFRSSQAIFALGESSLQNVAMPEGAIIGVLGDGWWNSPDAAANPDTKAFAEAYRAKYGSYPVFPAMKMANSFLYLKQAYETAMQKNGGTWPSRDEVAEAMRGSTVKTFTGTTVTREDNDGIVDQIVGVTVKSPDFDFPVLGEMVRYDGEALMPPVGEDPIAWISTLPADLLASQPKPGSYK
ncbi:ABC transporter substrate-binding protein [Rhizobiaceae bacterium BDR2-2]|uniref:ABC transporter substrate-binding protein n=1 Tax=Ectorhizobium quercum TaxID=2965071 RepID=A0AAE3MY08_9HYPH|nr:ABC transporter substrate-binding protein [Ectorhizobium quercum]MCX8997108.1 ABC transporter substrate-binding protein [Ectorhizobium quercum]